MIIGQGLLVLAIGLVIGAAATFGLVRLIRSLLFGVGATDPVVLASVVVLLTVAVLMACLFPARRATRIDPVVALGK